MPTQLQPPSRRSSVRMLDVADAGPFTLLMQPLVKPLNQHVPAQVRCITETAEVLQISEFEVFELAHRWWFDRAADPRTLEQAFADYLLRQEVAAWVRQYCRRVVNLAAVNQLDPRDFGVERPTVHRVTPGEQRYAVLTSLVALLAYLLIFA